MREVFARLARRTALVSGSASVFMLAVLVIVVWAVTGPLFHFSDTWQLVINTGTTIVTFLMVFLIQNSQNHEALATQLKLDELLRAVERASDAVINIEELSESELLRLQEKYRMRSDRARTTDSVADAIEASEDAADTLRTPRNRRRPLVRAS